MVPSDGDDTIAMQPGHFFSAKRMAEIRGNADRGLIRLLTNADFR
jgi:hypothetical protein